MSIRGGACSVIVTLAMAACASNDEPRTAQDALAGSDSARAAQTGDLHCVDRDGRPVTYDSPSGHYQGMCHNNPVIVQRQRAPSSDTSPPASSVPDVQRMPESLQLPPTPVPLGGGGGIGILR